jgi:hypothetical protein
MISPYLKQLFCRHEDIIRGVGSRMFVSCVKCGRDSEGIMTGGLFRVQSNTQRAAAVARTFRPRRKR